MNDEASKTEEDPLVEETGVDIKTETLMDLLAETSEIDQEAASIVEKKVI